MSTGKRLAKRSILGTRVAAPGDDGLYYTGVIAAVKSTENSVLSSADSAPTQPALSYSNRYSVRFDLTRKVREYPEADILGPGFSGLAGVKLRPGQVVYVTFSNREMQGSVVCHRPNIDQVIIRLLNGGPEVKKKLEEVRLLESRKSARLIGHGDTDFSKLADFNIVHERKRLNSETSDMSSGTTSFLCSVRKRRGSDTLSDSSDEGDYGLSPWSSSEERSTTPVMSECTAAMVLMNLSHAQMAAAMPEHSLMMQKRTMMHEDTTQNCPQDLSTTSLLSTSTPVPSSASSSPSSTVASASPPIQDGSSSPLSTTSGASSLGSSWTPRPSPRGPSGTPRATPFLAASQQLAVANLTEAEALLQLSHCQESDEGIVSDQSSVADPEDPSARRNKTEHVRIIYQCTWPKCGIKMDVCSDMERHVRSKHLMKQPSDEDLEGEEEFYFTEVEVPLHLHDFTMLASKTMVSTSAPPTVTLHALPSNLADHMDMARPPHENPEYNFAQHQQREGHAPITFNVSHHHQPQPPRPLPAHNQPRRPAHMAFPPPPPPAAPPSSSSASTFSPMSAAAMPIAIPVTNLQAFASSAPPAHSSSHPHQLHHHHHHHHHHGKYIRLSPKPNSFGAPAPNMQQQQQQPQSNLMAIQQQQQITKSSPIRRPRGDAKKCRKVYGMDHRELWCTQCKWKKACTRFGEAA